METRFQGILPPVTTPFSEGGEVLWEALEANLERYCRSRLGGLLLLGSNGEAPHLSIAEKVELVGRACSVVRGRKGIVVGVASPTLRGARELVEAISDLEIQALLVSTPSYYRNRMGHDALFHFYSHLADTSPWPLLLYNVPQFSGISLDPALVRELAAHPQIAGMKESSGNLVYLQRIQVATRAQDFQIVLGSAQVLGPALLLGVQAAILAVACAVPELVVELVEAFQSGQDISSRQQDLFVIAELLTTRYGIPGLKYAMDLEGFEGRSCRPPLLPLRKTEKREIAEVLARLAAPQRQGRRCSSSR